MSQFVLEERGLGEKTIRARRFVCELKASKFKCQNMRFNGTGRNKGVSYLY